MYNTLVRMGRTRVRGKKMEYAKFVQIQFCGETSSVWTYSHMDINGFESLIFLHIWWDGMGYTNTEVWAPWADPTDIKVNEEAICKYQDALVGSQQLFNNQKIRTKVGKYTEKWVLVN